jgi:hypothetical protein
VAVLRMLDSGQRVDPRHFHYRTSLPDYQFMASGSLLILKLTITGI